MQTYTELPTALGLWSKAQRRSLPIPSSLPTVVQARCQIVWSELMRVLLCCGEACKILPSEILRASEIAGGSFPCARYIAAIEAKHRSQVPCLSNHQGALTPFTQTGYSSDSRVSTESISKAYYYTRGKCSVPSALSFPECKLEHSVSFPSVSIKHSGKCRTLGNLADSGSGVLELIFIQS